MERSAKQERISEYRRLCRERGKRCTEQRMTILETVLDLDNHPTADEVFDAVSDRLADVARTTVYPDDQLPAALFDELNGKLAMKVMSPDVVHKSDVGGVVLGVDSAEKAV